VKALQTLADHDDPGAAQLPAAIDSLRRILRGPDVQFPICASLQHARRPACLRRKFAQADSVLAMWAAAARTRAVSTIGNRGCSLSILPISGIRLRVGWLRACVRSHRSPAFSTCWRCRVFSKMARTRRRRAGGALYQTGHVYSDYVRMMQYWSFSARGDTRRPTPHCGPVGANRLYLMARSAERG